MSPEPQLQLTMQAMILAVALYSSSAASKATPGIPRRPLMGWNTWCTQNDCTQDWCTSDEVLDVARTIKSLGMQELGWNHIDLDDCWSHRNPVTKEIEGDPDRFPEGMPAFIAKLNAMGFAAGVYTDWGATGCHPQFAGSWPYYAQDAATFARWNVSVVKLDGCGAPGGFSPEQLTANFSGALGRTKAPVWLYFHCWYTESCAQYGNSFRVFTDHHDNWPSTVSVVKFLQDNRTSYWGPGADQGFPDPDFLMTGGAGCGNFSAPGTRCPGQTEDEYMTEFAIWAVAGGQMLFATDPRNMTDFMKGVLMNREVIDVFKDTEHFDHIAVLPWKSEPRVDGSVGLTSGSVGLTSEIGSGFTAATTATTATTTTGATKTDRPSCNATLWHQQSHRAQCTEGETFGCYTDGTERMWTQGGCKGLFYCDDISIGCGSEDDQARHNCSCEKPPRAAWVRPLSRASDSESDGCVAVVLLNPTESPSEVGVRFEELPLVGWGAGTVAQVRDLWSHEEQGTATGVVSQPAVPAHGNSFLRLCKTTTDEG